MTQTSDNVKRFLSYDKYEDKEEEEETEETVNEEREI